MHTHVEVFNDALQLDDMTEEDGTYGKLMIPMGNEVVVAPEREDPANYGLSTLGLFMGQQYILGKRPEGIYSPYQIVAGDANCDGAFTTIDLGIIQQVILGLRTDFPGCPSWVFIPAADPMPQDFNATNVFPYRTRDTLMIMKDTVSNFVGVKIGDLLGLAEVSTFEPSGVTTWGLEPGPGRH